MGINRFLCVELYKTPVYLYSCLYYFAVKVHLNIHVPCTVESSIYWVLGEVTVVREMKFQILNINKSYFFANLMQLEGISTADLDTKYLFNVLNYIIYGVNV